MAAPLALHQNSPSSGSQGHLDSGKLPKHDSIDLATDVDSDCDTPKLTTVSKQPAYGGAKTHRVDIKPVLKGRVKPVDTRRFKFDVIRGRATAPGFEVTKDDRMSPQEGGQMLDQIHTTFGLAGKSAGDIFAFNQALFINHAINGGSTIAPGRAFFYVDGYTAFSTAKVRDILGVNNRRFWRCFADAIKDAIKSFMSNYDPFNLVQDEIFNMIVSVARSRGIARYPHLCHDSADACLEVDAAEAAAVASSKQFVLSSSMHNNADTLKQVRPLENPMNQES